MTVLPLHDRDGNTLVDIRLVPESALGPRVVVPASLVVVTHTDAVLMMFDSRRRRWELPGGMREQGESPCETAVRELREETGIHGVELSFAVVAEFDLVRPRRRELLAVYEVRLAVVPPLTVNEEALAFRWWPAADTVPPDMSPLDAEIARRVVGEP